MVIYSSRYTEKLFYYIFPLSLAFVLEKELCEAAARRDVYRRMYLLVSGISLIDENLFYISFFDRAEPGRLRRGSKGWEGERGSE